MRHVSAVCRIQRGGGEEDLPSTILLVQMTVFPRGPVEPKCFLPISIIDPFAIYHASPCYVNIRKMQRPNYPLACRRTQIHNPLYHRYVIVKPPKCPLSAGTSCRSISAAPTISTGRMPGTSKKPRRNRRQHLFLRLNHKHSTVGSKAKPFPNNRKPPNQVGQKNIPSAP